MLIRTFYNGVTRSTRDTIDAVAGGSLMRKTVEAAFSLLEEMTNNNCLWPSERQNPPRQGGRIGVDTVTALQAQIAALTKQLSNLTNKNNPTTSGENCNFVGYFNNEFGVFDAGMVGDGY